MSLIVVSSPSIPGVSRPVFNAKQGVRQRPHPLVGDADPSATSDPSFALDSAITVPPRPQFASWAGHQAVMEVGQTPGRPDQEDS